MKKISILSLVLLTSCTYSINLVHSNGQASDVIDENQRADPTINPNLNLTGL